MLIGVRVQSQSYMNVKYGMVMPHSCNKSPSLMAQCAQNTLNYGKIGMFQAKQASDLRMKSAHPQNCRN